MASSETRWQVSQWGAQFITIIIIIIIIIITIITVELV